MSGIRKSLVFRLMLSINVILNAYSGHLKPHKIFKCIFLNAGQQIVYNIIITRNIHDEEKKKLTKIKFVCLYFRIKIWNKEIPFHYSGTWCCSHEYFRYFCEWMDRRDIKNGRYILRFFSNRTIVIAFFYDST